MEVPLNHNPRAINVAAFAVARADELKTMMNSVSSHSSCRTTFQRVPRHMRRRAMSHKLQRLPRRLRAMAAREKAASTVLSPKGKDSSVARAKSRRQRRRHGNLREEYAKRQGKTRWLETHIWHAKRFKVVERWGWKIPLHPSDKSARATYRATARHCVLTDISYHQVVELEGQEVNILAAMKHLTSPDIGLTVASKAYLAGTRHGEVLLYHRDSYPHRPMAPVSYLWQASATPSNCPTGKLWGKRGVGEGVVDSAGKTEREKLVDTVGKTDGRRVKEEEEERMDIEGEEEKKKERPGRRLWMWVHPSCWSEVWTALSAVCQDYDVSVSSLDDELLRFRLQGPLAHPILLDALHVAMVTPDDASTVKEHPMDASKLHWWEEYFKESENLQTYEKQSSSWGDMGKIQSATELATNSVVSLTVRDPRIMLPKKKTKIKVDSDDLPDVPSNISHKVPAELSVSPLWSPNIRKAVAEEQKSTHEINQLRSQLLVPGTDLRLGRDESRIPVLLLQHSGHRSPVGEGPEGSPGMLGYGSGWDLVLPRKWGMAFWVGLIYRGARACGIREAGKVALHRSIPRFPDDYPDGDAGQAMARAVSEDLQETFLKRPPAKRVNHAKLGISHPFCPPWARLVSEWVAKVTCDQVPGDDDIASVSGESEDVYVLRSRDKLRALKTEIQDWQKQRGNGNGKLRRRAKVDVRRHLQTATESRKWEGKPQKGVDASEASSTDVLFKSLLPSESRTLVWVGFQMMGRGFPTQFAVICLPDAVDLAELRRDPSYGGPTEPVHKEFGLKRVRQAEKKRKVEKSKKAKVAKASLPEAPSTPADLGYVGGQNRKGSKTSVAGDKEMKLVSSSEMEESMDLSEPSVQKDNPEGSCIAGNDSIHAVKEGLESVATTSATSCQGDHGTRTSATTDKSVAAAAVAPASSADSCSVKKPTEETKASGQGDPTKTLSKAQPDLLKSCTRTIIGFVTNGAQAFSSGRGMGVGFCATLGLVELLKISPRGRKLVVLVRNVQSLQYRFAVIYIP